MEVHSRLSKGLTNGSVEGQGCLDKPGHLFLDLRLEGLQVAQEEGVVNDKQ
jgi:hypothetical protein